MSFATKHNKGGIDWKVDTTNFKFLKREDAYKKDPEKVYTLRGLYINTKGQFKDHPVAILDDCLLDLPDYMTEDVLEILHTEEDIAAILNGVVGFKIEEFTDKKFKKTCYGIKWVDLED